MNRTNENIKKKSVEHRPDAADEDAAGAEIAARIQISGEST
jgi:hypothetical protein